MHQLQIHLRNHLQAYTLNFAEGSDAKMNFDVITNRRKGKLPEIIVIADDFGGMIAIDCTEISTHLLCNTENLMRINVQQNIDAQILGKKLALQANSRPSLQPATGIVL